MSGLLVDVFKFLKTTTQDVPSSITEIFDLELVRVDGSSSVVLHLPVAEPNVTAV